MFLQNFHGMWIVKAFLSSNSHWDIIRLSLLLSKLSIMEWTNLLGKPTAVYLLTIHLISMSNLEAIFLALCNSPIIELRLYLTGIFDVQCAGSFFILLDSWVVILLLLRIISVSRNLIGSNSKVNFIFSWYKFNALCWHFNTF